MSSIGHALLDLWVDVSCPACDAPFEVQVAQIACQVYRHCPVCVCLIHLTDSSAGVHRTAEEVNDVLEDFGDQISRMFK